MEEGMDAGSDGGTESFPESSGWPWEARRAAAASCGPRGMRLAHVLLLVDQVMERCSRAGGFGAVERGSESSSRCGWAPGSAGAEDDGSVAAGMEANVEPGGSDVEEVALIEAAALALAKARFALLALEAAELGRRDRERCINEMPEVTRFIFAEGNCWRVSTVSSAEAALSSAMTSGESSL
jgi:hypothetical protein